VCTFPPERVLTHAVSLESVRVSDSVYQSRLAVLCRLCSVPDIKLKVKTSRDALTPERLFSACRAFLSY